MWSLHLWGPSFCSSLVIWLDTFCTFLTCLWGLCRALPCQLGILLLALHFPARLCTCQDCLFKEHPIPRTSIFSSDAFFLSFLLPANALHLLEFAFPELIIFSSSASFLFLRKEMLYLKKHYDFHRRFSFLSSSLILPLLKIELKGILPDDAFCNNLPLVQDKIHFRVFGWPIYFSSKCQSSR